MHHIGTLETIKTCVCRVLCQKGEDQQADLIPVNDMLDKL